MEYVYCENVFMVVGNLIYIWYCCTHNLKSAKNQRIASPGSITYKRVFHDRHLIYLGWNGVNNQWDREMQRISRGRIQESDLSLSSVSPDSWNKI